MKKILLILAAVVSCAVLMAKEEYQADGALIAIGGTKYMTTPVLCTGEIPELEHGMMIYDTVNHVLTLANVQIETSSETGALMISAENMPKGSRNIEIRLVGNNYILNSKDGKSNAFSHGLGLSGERITITGMSGNLYISTNAGMGLFVGGDELVIQEGAMVYTGYTAGGMYTRLGTVAVPSTAPVLTVDCAHFESYGTEVSLSMDVQLNDAALSGSYTYDGTKKCYVDDKGNAVKGNNIIFYKTKNLFWLANGDEGGGTLSAKKNGKEISNPYRYIESEEAGDDIEITATASSGWQFRKWAGLGAIVSDNKNATTTAQLPITGDAMVVAQFDYTQHAAPGEPWYVISNAMNGVYKMADYYTDAELLEELLKTGISKKALACATYAEGRLYFIDHIDGTHSTLQSALFDPETGAISDQKDVFASQTTYPKFYGITYDVYGDYIYATATKGDNKEYLLRIQRATGAIKEIGELQGMSISMGEKIGSIAINKQGVLYGVMQGYLNYTLYTPYRGSGLLCEIDSKTAKWKSIGVTGEYYESDACAMAFDYKTGALVGTTYSGYSSSIVSYNIKTGHATRLSEWIHLNNGQFQLIPKSVPVKVEVKSGQEDMGEAVILETGKQEGRYMPGDKVDIEAFKKTNEYRFVKWSDGSTENPRTVKIGEEASYTYTAEFDWAEGIVAYPIWIDKKQFNSYKLTMDNSNNTAISTGSAQYDPESNTLTLNALDASSDEIALRIGSKEDSKTTVSVVLKGTTNLATYGTTVISLINADVTFNGPDELSTSSYYTSSAMELKDADVTFVGTNMTIAGNSYGIRGTEKEKLIVRGSNIQVSGVDGAIVGIGSLDVEYCAITAPSGADFNETSHSVEDGGGVVKGGLNPVKFKSWPQVRVTPREEGTGTFILRSADAKFENVGWFASSTPVTIIAQPADGFEFARWSDDMKWGDETKQEEWLTETREITTTGLDENYNCIFYYTPKSNKTWYAVHGGSYISFDMSDRAAHPIKASAPAATTVSAGDYRSGNLDYQDGLSLKTMPFSGVDKDEPLSGKDDIADLVASPGVVFVDMSYDLKNKEMYGIYDDGLYRVDYNSDPMKVDKVGDIVDDKANKLYPYGIAVDATGTMYLLLSGIPGTLYRVNEIDEDKKKVVAEPVGEEDGRVGRNVDAVTQNIAFDHSTGELFWGANDYLRVIDTETAKSYICGDLGYKKGYQGYMKAMHCMSKLVKVTVKIADDHDSWGTVSVSNAGFGAGQFIAGQKATITATPKDGYKFLYWTKGSSEDELEDASYTFKVTSNVTYWAHFKKIPQDEGVESIQSSEVSLQKVLIDGSLYIIRDGKVYNVTGNRVK
ncbi:MAG: hypothetical protein J5884_05165 [Paludibacteraceae bacterium]|nr:hypothetical protein [Paludibacteraceae bacterium]